MTTIAIVRGKDRVVIGSESQCTGGSTFYDFKIDKIYAGLIGGNVAAVCTAGCVRSAQLFELFLGEHSQGIIAPKQFVFHVKAALVPALRAYLQANGALRTIEGAERWDTHVMIITEHAMVLIDDNFCVLEPSDNFFALGSGASYALGALDATRNLSLSPRQRVKLALEAAKKYDIFSGGRLKTGEIIYGNAPPKKRHKKTPKVPKGSKEALEVQSRKRKRPA